MAEGAMRLDRFLWFARLTKTRNAAAELAATGRLRCDGRLIEKPAACVRVGNVLTFAAHGRVRTVRVEALPARRGPPVEGRACYTDLTPGTEAPGAANVSQQAPLD